MLDDVEFFDLTDYPEIPLQHDDIQYAVTGVDRIDTLAAKFYGDEVLWWVIALANDMELLPRDLNVTDVLRIPSPRYVLQELFKPKKGKAL